MCGIAGVHRRLSILDLSSNWHQLMLPTSGRYFIACNGKFYNHLHSRNQLKVVSLQPIEGKGHSDIQNPLANARSSGDGAVLAYGYGYGYGNQK